LLCCERGPRRITESMAVRTTLDPSSERRPSCDDARNRGAVARPRPRCRHRGYPRRHPERVGGL